jgi:hypothetical protein
MQKRKPNEREDLPIDPVAAVGIHEMRVFVSFRANYAVPVIQRARALAGWPASNTIVGNNIPIMKRKMDPWALGPDVALHEIRV